MTPAKKHEMELEKLFKRFPNYLPDFKEEIQWKKTFPQHARALSSLIARNKHDLTHFFGDKTQPRYLEGKIFFKQADRLRFNNIHVRTNIESNHNIYRVPIFKSLFINDLIRDRKTRSRSYEYTHDFIQHHDWHGIEHPYVAAFFNVGVQKRDEYAVELVYKGFNRGSTNKWWMKKRLLDQLLEFEKRNEHPFYKDTIVEYVIDNMIDDPSTHDPKEFKYLLERTENEKIKPELAGTLAIRMLYTYGEENKTGKAFKKKVKNDLKYISKMEDQEKKRALGSFRFMMSSIEEKFTGNMKAYCIALDIMNKAKDKELSKIGKKWLGMNKIECANPKKYHDIEFSNLGL